MKIVPSLPGEHLWSVAVRSIQSSGFLDDSVFNDMFALARFSLQPANGACKVTTRLAQRDEFAELLFSGTAYPLWLLNFDKPEQTAIEVQSEYFNRGRESQLNMKASSWKYCACCAKEDRLRYGTSYWHIEHNLPFVTHCIQHGTPLSMFLGSRSLIATKMPHRLQVTDSVETNVPHDLLEWSRFVVAIYKMICANHSSVLRLRNLIWDRFSLAPITVSGRKLYLRRLLEGLENMVPSNLLQMCFQFYSDKKRRKSNILYTTWKRDGIQIRHPVYMLIILFWLQCEGVSVIPDDYESPIATGHSVI